MSGLAIKVSNEYLPKNLETCEETRSPNISFDFINVGLLLETLVLALSL